MVALDLFLITLAALAATASWMGWGRLVARAAGVRVRAPVATALGSALVIALGGFAALFEGAGSPFLLSMSAAGILLLLLPPHRKRRWLPPFSACHAPILVAAIAAAFVGLFAAVQNPADDAHAYVVFPKQFEQTGTLVAPFAMRRLSTYGGFALLQAQLRSIAGLIGPAHLPDLLSAHHLLLDGGIASVLSVALLWSLLRPRSHLQQVLAVGAVGLYAMTSIPRANSQAQQEATWMLLAMGVLLRLVRGSDRRSLAAMTLAALLAAVVATFRINYALAAVAAIGLRGWALPRPSPRARVLCLTAAAFAIVLALFPWALMLLKSSGTPLYPAVPGHEYAEFLFLGPPPTLVDRLAHLLVDFTDPRTFILLLLLPMALLIRPRREAVALYLAAIGALAVTSWMFLQGDREHPLRYCEPLLKAAFWLTAIIALRRWRRHSPLARAILVMALFALPAVEQLRLASLPWTAAVPLLAAGAAATVAAAFRSFAAAARRAAVALLALAALALAPAIQNGAMFYLCALAAGLVLLIRLDSSGLRTPAVVALGILMPCGLFALFRFNGGWLAMAWSLFAAGILVALFSRHASASLSRGACRIAAMLLAGPLLVLDPGALPSSLAPFLPPLLLSVLVLLLGRSPTAAWCPGAFLLTASVVAASVLGPHSHRLRELVPHESAMRDHVIHQRAQYAKAQSAVPSRAGVLALVPEPLFLDFGRNRIAVVDWPITSLGRSPRVSLDGPTEPIFFYLHDFDLLYALVAPPRTPAASPLFQEALLRNSPLFPDETTPFVAVPLHPPKDIMPPMTGREVP